MCPVLGGKARKPANCDEVSARKMGLNGNSPAKKSQTKRWRIAMEGCNSEEDGCETRQN